MLVSLCRLVLQTTRGSHWGCDLLERIESCLFSYLKLAVWNPSLLQEKYPWSLFQIWSLEFGHSEGAPHQVTLTRANVGAVLSLISSVCGTQSFLSAALKVSGIFLYVVVLRVNWFASTIRLFVWREKNLNGLWQHLPALAGSSALYRCVLIPFSLFPICSLLNWVFANLRERVGSFGYGTLCERRQRGSSVGLHMVCRKHNLWKSC